MQRTIQMFWQTLAQRLLVSDLLPNNTTPRRYGRRASDKFTSAKCFIVADRSLHGPRLLFLGKARPCTDPAPCPSLYGPCPSLYGLCPALYGLCPSLYGPCPSLYGPCPSLYGPCLAWPARLQPTLNTILLQDVVLEESGEMPETEIHQKNSNIIYTHVKCKCRNS